MNPIILSPHQDPPNDADYVLVNQCPRSGKVTVSGNVQDSARSAKFLPTQTFWSKDDPGGDEERGMQAAEQWATSNGIESIYVRRSPRDA